MRFLKRIKYFLGGFMIFLKRIEYFLKRYYASYYSKKTVELYKKLDPGFLKKIREERKRVYEKYN